MKLKLRPILLFTTTGVLAAILGYALASNTANHDGHSSHEVNLTSLPTQSGQSAFAAIEEIVTILEKDPETDWSQVNIRALREHLVDMDALTLGASVSTKVEGENISFIATGSGTALRALHNMVPAHAHELNKMSKWSANGVKTPDGAILTITPTSKSDIQKIKALGFFGLMATGGHHQPHHLGMATGKMIH